MTPTRQNPKRNTTKETQKKKHNERNTTKKMVFWTYVFLETLEIGG